MSFLGALSSYYRVVPFYFSIYMFSTCVHTHRLKTKPQTHKQELLHWYIGFYMAFKETLSVLYLEFLLLCCPPGFHPNLSPSLNLPLSLYSSEFSLPDPQPLTNFLISMRNETHVSETSKSASRNERRHLMFVFLGLSYLSPE